MRSPSFISLIPQLLSSSNNSRELSSAISLFQSHQNSEMSSPDATNHPSSDERSERMDLLRAALPECQPQEGSPANTFTQSELDALRSVMQGLNLGPRDPETTSLVKAAHKLDIFSAQQFTEPPTATTTTPKEEAVTPPQERFVDDAQPQEDQPQEDVEVVEKQPSIWHGAPKIGLNLPPQSFRESVRRGEFTGPTNGTCPGYMQCNLVVLPQGPHAFDFLLFCQRNKKACPLIEVCDVGSPHPNGVARGADLRTDIPK